MDVAFVLDLSSGDLGLIYRVSLPFIRLVADGLPLRPDRVRVAFVTAVNVPTVQFYFNTYRYCTLYTRVSSMYTNISLPQAFVSDRPTD